MWEDHVLTNADEIMPDGYGINQLRNDSSITMPFLNILQKVPKLVRGALDFTSVGRSSFVSNEMADHRTADHYHGGTVSELLQSMYARR